MMTLRSNGTCALAPVVPITVVQILNTAAVRRVDGKGRPDLSAIVMVISPDFYALDAHCRKGCAPHPRGLHPSTLGLVRGCEVLCPRRKRPCAGCRVTEQRDELASSHGWPS